MILDEKLDIDVYDFIYQSRCKLLDDSISLLIYASHFISDDRHILLNGRLLELLRTYQRLYLNGAYSEEVLMLKFGEWCGIVSIEEEYLKLIINLDLSKVPTTRVAMGDLHTVEDFAVVEILSSVDFYAFFSRKDSNRKDKQEKAKPLNGIIDNYVQSRKSIYDKVDTRDTRKRNFTCLLSKKQIKALYELLVEDSFISSDTTFDDFHLVFSSNNDPVERPVFWQKKTILLTYLLYELFEKRQLISGNWQTHLGDRKQAFFVKTGIVRTSNYSSTMSNIKSASSSATAAYQSKIRPIIDLVTKVKA